MENFENKAVWEVEFYSWDLRVLRSLRKTLGCLREMQNWSQEDVKETEYFKFVCRAGSRCMESWNPFLLLASPILLGPLVHLIDFVVFISTII